MTIDFLWIWMECREWNGKNKNCFFIVNGLRLYIRYPCFVFFFSVVAAPSLHTMVYINRIIASSSDEDVKCENGIITSIWNHVIMFVWQIRCNDAEHQMAWKTPKTLRSFHFWMAVWCGCIAYVVCERANVCRQPLNDPPKDKLIMSRAHTRGKHQAHTASVSWRPP